MSEPRPIDKLSVKDLQRELTTRSLSTTGRKAELVTRLVASVGSSTITPTPPTQQAGISGKDQGAESGRPEPAAAADDAAPAGFEAQIATKDAYAVTANDMADPQDHEQDEDAAGSPAEDVIAFDQTLTEDQHGDELSDFGEGGLETLKDADPAEQESKEEFKEAEAGPPETLVKEEQQPAVQEDAKVDVKQEAKQAALPPPRQEGELPEWEAMTIPMAWRPLPLLKLKNVSRTADERAVRTALEGAGLSVRSVCFDSTLDAGRSRTAIVRLHPPELPWQTTEEALDASGKPLEGDCTKVANLAAAKLKALEPPLEIAGEAVQAESATLQVELFIGNLTEQWEEEKACMEAMKEFGTVERLAMICNPDGVSKGYAFVEFSRPSEAQRCKDAMDKIELEMRPDVRQRISSRASGGGAAAEQPEQRMPFQRWEQVKLLRAEWSRPKTVQSLFSRVLYISNLKPGFKDISLLRSIFEDQGEINECHLPRNKQTGNSKGFAFVEFMKSADADKALRDLDGTEHEMLGKLLVSFANPAKPYGAPTTSQGGNRAGAGPGPNRIGSFDGSRKSSFPGGSGMGLQNRNSMGGQMGPGGPIRQASFGGRGAPFGAPAGGRGRGAFGAPPAGAPGLAAGAGPAGGFMNPQMNQAMQMRAQQQQQANAQLQIQARMQAEVRQQTLALQRQVQQAQQQAQQAQQQAAAAQAAAQAMQRKAQQEEQARRREEEQRRLAERAAASRMMPKDGSYGSGGYGGQLGGAGGSQDMAGYGSYNSAQGMGGAGSAGGSGSYSGAQGMNSQAYGQGSMGNGQQGYGASNGGNDGYGGGAGASSMGMGGYGSGAGGASGYGSHQGGNGGGNYGGYGTSQGGAGVASSGGGYGQGSGGYGQGSYGAQGAGSSYGGGNGGYGSQAAGGYGSGNQSNYGSGYGQGYGSYGANGSSAAASGGMGGFGQGQGSYNSSGYGGSGQQQGEGGYGTSSASAGQKRDSGDYGGYNQSAGYGSYGSYGQNDNKRSRYG